MEYVWGVDPSTKLIAVAFARETTAAGYIGTSSYTLPQRGQHGERLATFRDEIDYQTHMLRLSRPPCCVWVEQPAGKFVAPVSQMVVGILCATLFEVLRCPVWLIPPDKWKKPAVGKAGASKDEIAAWAREQGIEFGCQDEADAAGIAYAGRWMWLERRFDV
jgi:Holliday junction resolvasome RuvABC endonuclease subunit